MPTQTSDQIVDRFVVRVDKGGFLGFSSKQTMIHFVQDKASSWRRINLMALVVMAITVMVIVICCSQVFISNASERDVLIKLAAKESHPALQTFIMSLDEDAPMDGSEHSTDEHILFKSTNEISTVSGDPPRSNTGVHLLVIGRMSSGTSALARQFTDRADFFYAYEPGHMLFKVVHDKNVFIDTKDNLEEIQPEMCKFFGDLYHCDLASHDYFLTALNTQNIYRIRGTFRDLNYPLTQGKLTSFCRSKSHILSKVVRFNDMKPCLPTLERENVKMIFLVRDPRGLVSSRLRRWETNLMKNRYGIEVVAKEHCDWLEVVLQLLKSDSEYLRNNSMLIRFEDMCLYPDIINRAVYDFVGLPDPPKTSKSHEKSTKQWFTSLDYQRMKKIQDACPRHIYEDYGWVYFNNEEEFKRAEYVWYNPMPQDDVTLKYHIP